MDYMDADVAYLTGLILARGTFREEEGVYTLLVEFPYRNLEIKSGDLNFDQSVSIKAGIHDIQRRIYEVLGTDVEVREVGNSILLVARFLRRSIAWRNLKFIFGNRQSYKEFLMPDIFLSQETPTEWKRELIRGFGDVAGNIRPANRYIDGRHRVRLDVLNNLANWELPVQICTLLQEHLEVPVQLISWGHPNLNRGFREHQVNIFAHRYLAIGFSFQHKQQILESLAQKNLSFPTASIEDKFCPGYRRSKQSKPVLSEENSSKLPDTLRGKHFDHYWEICHALGCKRILPLEEDVLTGMAEEVDSD